MKINLGCGRWTLDGWYNIDAAPSPLASRAPDLLCDVKKIPLPDQCADEVMAIHLFEHLWRWECEKALKEWRRLLKYGGLLIMEMPDLVKCCFNIVHHIEGKHPEQLGMWGIYGDPTELDPLMMHRWGWTFATVKPLLESVGFREVFEHRTEWHRSGRDVRDFRVTARKM